MSAKFNGFSQEDIKKLTKKQPALPTFSGHNNIRGVMGIRRLPIVEKKSKEDKMKQKSQIKLLQNNNIVDDDKLLTMSEDNNNSNSMTSLQDAIHFHPPSSRRTIETIDSSLLSSDNQKEEENPNENVSLQTDESILHLDMNKNGSSNQTNEIKQSPFKGISLKDFENQRKFIEEQNKQKKELLYKAIEHHSQKTAAETKKIEEIKEELSKLDTELAADVAILRKEIELATIQYSNIQKRYQRIEADFLKAKMEIYQASEKKELLTEHLCTVISHNEDRKAKRLSELMEKVGLSPTGDLENSN